MILSTLNRWPVIAKTSPFLFLFLLGITSPARAMPLETFIAQYNEAEAPAIASSIRYSAYRHDLDPLLVASVLYVESRYDNTAVSSAGALGISQLMPDTAADLGINPYDLRDNIEGGAQYLSDMIRQTDRTDTGLAAYNAGPGAVKDGIPSYTLDYIADATGKTRRLPRQNPGARENSGSFKLSEKFRKRLLTKKNQKKKNLSSSSDIPPQNRVMKAISSGRGGKLVTQAALACFSSGLVMGCAHFGNVIIPCIKNFYSIFL